MKSFFKPTKAKVMIASVLIVYSLLLILRERTSAGGYDFFNPANLGKNLANLSLQGPGVFIYDATTRMLTFEEACGVIPLGFCDVFVVYRTFIINPWIAYFMIIVSSIAYWYLLACIIAWLLSLRKKQPPQTPPSS